MVERGSHFSGAPHQRLELSVPLTAPIRRVVSALAADYKSPVVPLATELLWNLLDNSPAAAAIAASPSDAAQFAATLTQLTHALLQRGYRCVCVCVRACVCVPCQGSPLGNRPRATVPWGGAGATVTLLRVPEPLCLYRLCSQPGNPPVER